MYNFTSHTLNYSNIKMMNTLQRTEIDRFITSGECDNSFQMWSGNSFMEQSIKGSNALRDALISEVLMRAGQVSVLACHDDELDINARAKFAPMVRGLFPLVEQSTILDMLESSVIFLTPATIKRVLEKSSWLHTSWDLANLYLASIGAKMLADTEHEIVGLSEDTTCFVSIKYFSSNNPFEDYVIHEAAHIFHNCKRERLGLPGTRRREWLLEIDYAKRETFAYACEAYSRILELGGTRLARSQLLSELAEGQMPTDERVDEDEYVDILREAVAARNGWKYIFARCSRAKPLRCG